MLPRKLLTYFNVFPLTPYFIFLKNVLRDNLIERLTEIEFDEVYLFLVEGHDAPNLTLSPTMFRNININPR